VTRRPFAHCDDSESRRIVAQRPVNWAGRHHLHFAISSERILVKMAGEHRFDTGFLEELEVGGSRASFDVEILVAFVGRFQEQGLMLEDDDVLCAGSPGAVQLVTDP